MNIMPFIYRIFFVRFCCIFNYLGDILSFRLFRFLSLIFFLTFNFYNLPSIYNLEEFVSVEKKHLLSVSLACSERRIQQLSEQVDHVGDHVGPVEQRVTLLLRVNLRDDDLPRCRLIEELHHRLRTQHC